MIKLISILLFVISANAFSAPSLIKIVRKSDGKEMEIIADGNIPPKYKGQFDDQYDKIFIPFDKVKAKDAIKDDALKEIIKDFEARIDALEKK